jgi:hypothetical protein
VICKFNFSSISLIKTRLGIALYDQVLEGLGVVGKSGRAHDRNACSLHAGSNYRSTIFRPPSRRCGKTDGCGTSEFSRGP